MGRYDAQWKRYRRLRLVHRIGIWAFFPILVVLEFLHLSYGISVPFLIIQLYILFFAVASFRFYFFRCPRCRRFFATVWRYTPRLFERECLHCGLKKFSDGEMPSAASAAETPTSS
jgi:hypothetical protein